VNPMTFDIEIDPGGETVRGRKFRDMMEQVVAHERNVMGGLGAFERWLTYDRAKEKTRRAFDFVNEGLAAPYRGRIVPVMRGGANSPFTAVIGNPAAAPSSFTAVNTTNVETNLWVPAIWSPIPGNDMQAGKVYKHDSGGILSTSSAAPTSLWTPRVGQSATPASNVTMGASTAVTMTASLSNVPWFSTFTFTIRALGLAASGGTGTGNGFIVIGDLTTTAAKVQSIGATVATTIDNTAATGYILSQTWGTNNASNSLQAQMVSPVYSLN